MNRTSISIGAASLAALACGAAQADEKTYDLAGFTGVSVSAGITAEIAVGGDYSVRAESSEEGLEKLDIRVKGDALEIRRKNMSFNFGRSAKVTVYVSMPELKELEASSGSDAIAGGVSGDAFALDASSGASAEVKGECGALSLDISSGAHVEAAEFKCKSATIDASSGASATVFVTDAVNADASSGGSVKILGEPKSVQTDSSSGGSVKVVK